MTVTWHGTPLGCFTPIEVRLGWFSTKLSMWYYVIPSDSLAWEHPEMNSSLVKTNLLGGVNSIFHPEMNSSLVKTNLLGELTPFFIWIYLSLGEDGSAVEGRSVCWNREKSRLRSWGVIAATRTQGFTQDMEIIMTTFPESQTKPSFATNAASWERGVTNQPLGSLR